MGSSFIGLSCPVRSLSLSHSFSRSRSSDDELASSLRWVSERMRLRRRFFLRAPDPATKDPSAVSSISSGPSRGIGDVQRWAGTSDWWGKKKKFGMMDYRQYQEAYGQQMLVFLPPCFHFPPQKKLLHCHPASCAGQRIPHLSQYPPKITMSHICVKELRESRERKLSRVVVQKKTLTIFSLERSTPSLPKRTWKGEHWNDPSGCRTTMTSIPPVSVAGFRPRYSSFTVTNTVSANWPTIFMVWDCGQQNKKWKQKESAVTVFCCLWLDPSSFYFHDVSSNQ